MAEWFPHDFHARHDPKMRVLRNRQGATGIGFYWCLVEEMHEQGGVIDRLSVEGVAGDLRLERWKEVLDDLVKLGLITVLNETGHSDDERYTIRRVADNIAERAAFAEERRNRARNGGLKSGLSRSKQVLHENEAAASPEPSTDEAGASKNRSRSQAQTNYKTDRTEYSSNTLQDTHTPRARSRDKLIPHIDRVKAHFLQAGSTEDDAQAFFDHYDAVDWTTNAGLVITNWQAKANTWIRKNHDQAHRTGTPDKPAHRTTAGRHVTLDQVKAMDADMRRRHGLPPAETDRVVHRALEQPRNGAGDHSDDRGAGLVAHAPPG